MPIAGTAGQIEFLRTVGARRIYLVEVQAWKISASAQQKMYFISEPYSDTDTGTYVPSLMGDIKLQQRLKDSYTGGAQVSSATITLNNDTGIYDEWFEGDIAFQGRQVTIWVIDPTDTFTTTRGLYAKAFLGSAESVARSDDSTVTLTCSQYGETQNVDIFPHEVGFPVTRLPKTYGSVRNFEPELDDLSLLKYTVHGGDYQSINGAYIRGVSQTLGTDHATEAALDAASVSAGTYDSCAASGLFRLGSSPDGLVTCDVQGPPGTGMDALAADIMVFVGQPGALPGVRQPWIPFDSGSIAQFKLDSPQICGRRYTEAVNINVALDEITDSVGSIWYYDNVGQVQVEQFDSPSATIRGDITSEEHVIGDVAVVMRPPVWRVEHRVQKNWAVSSDLPTGLSEAEALRLSTPYRYEVFAEDSATLVNWPSAQIVAVDSVAVNTASTQIEVDRVLAAHKGPRYAYSMKVWGRPCGYGLNETWTFTHPRLAPTGKDLVVVGIVDNLLTNTTDLILWG